MYILIRKPDIFTRWCTIIINFIFPRNETRRELERKLQTYRRELDDLKNIQSIECMVAMVSA